jgi:hypothetical protein
MGLRGAILWLQIFHVAFLLLHDWIPLGALNDLAAVRRENSRRALIKGTAISSLAFVLGLLFCFVYVPWPHWLTIYLLVAYVFLFLGELQAWWVPYLVWPQPRRAVRYEAMFGRTHAFLPSRNGIRPNTLHVILHIATLALVLLLAVQVWRP